MIFIAQVVTILLPIILIILLIIFHKLDEGKQRISSGQRDWDAGNFKYNQGLTKYNKYNNLFFQIFASRKLENGRRQLEEGRRRLEAGRRELENGKKKWNFWNRIRYILLGICVLNFLFLLIHLGYRISNVSNQLGLLIFVVLTLLWGILFFWIIRKLKIVFKCIWGFFWYCCYFIPLILI